MEGEGNLLKRAVQLSGKSVEEVAKIIGVGREYMYKLFLKEKISEDYFFLLQKTNIPVFVKLYEERLKKFNESLSSPNLTATIENLILRERVKDLLKIIQLQEESLKLYQEKQL